MAINTSVQDFTDAELLALTKKAIADILVGGQAYGTNGRQLTRADLPHLMELKDQLETSVAAADTDDGGTALVQFGERV